jgi:hypothetical protein
VSTGNAGSAALVVVDSGDGVVDQEALAGLGAARVTILSFTQSRATIDAVAGALPSSSDVAIESGAPAVDEVAPEVSDRYVGLLARVSREFELGGKPLAEALEFDDGASLWWLHELSGRRSDIYPTLTRLCQLEVARRALERVGAGELVLVSDDGPFSKAVASLCETLSIAYRGPRSAKANGGMSYRGVTARLAFWGGRTVAQTLLAKLLTRKQLSERADGRPVCAFHTLYPSFFISTGGEMDEKFLRVPNMVESHGVSPFIAVTFAADDGHQHMTMRAYLRACLMLRREPSFNDVPTRLIDRDLPWRGVFAGLVQGVQAALRSTSLERNRAFQGQWRLGEVDIFPLIQPELRMATYRLPRYLMHSRRMRAFVETAKPDAMASSLFEFCYGRATSYAVIGSNARPLNIGVQHGPTGRKLMYRYAPGEVDGEGSGPVHVPMPDHVILESEEALVALGDSGIPADQLHVLGAPRLDHLASAPRWQRAAARGDGPKRVLVIFGGSDGAQIMGIMKQVVERTGGYHFIMKPHPRSSIQADQIDALLTARGSSTYEIATTGIYDLMAKADVVVTTYSSAGMEAAALGYPVVVLNLPDFVSPSGLMDAADEVRFASSPDALVEALAESGSATASGGGDAERTFFSKLDGRAQERWAEAIARLTREHSVR